MFFITVKLFLSMMLQRFFSIGKLAFSAWIRALKRLVYVINRGPSLVESLILELELYCNLAELYEEFRLNFAEAYRCDNFNSP